MNKIKIEKPEIKINGYIKDLSKLKEIDLVIVTTSSSDALIKSEHEVIAVYTQPDRPAGRGRKINFGPIKQLALDANISIEQPFSLKDDGAQKTLRDYAADVMVVAAYGLILPQVVFHI